MIMSQILLPTAHCLSIDGSTTTSSGVAVVTAYYVSLVKSFEESIPLKIINNKLQINEKLLEEGKIYSIKHKGQEYFVRRYAGATEIFQMA